jgi:hypothetical protein
MRSPRGVASYSQQRLDFFPILWILDTLFFVCTAVFMMVQSRSMATMS